jgi:hypothetical protein
MASIPKVGDRITAKVKLTVYTDRECLKAFPILPPGPNGLRESIQYPGIKETGAEVGTYTGIFSDAGYEVNFLMQYSVAVKKVFIGWNYQNVTKAVKAWVKKEEATGFWDTGVDAPKVDSPAGSDNPADKTNWYLGAAIGLAAIWKFKKG